MAGKRGERKRLRKRWEKRMVRRVTERLTGDKSDETLLREGIRVNRVNGVITSLEVVSAGSGYTATGSARTA